MAKETGLGWTTCSVDDSGSSLRALVNDVTGVSFAIPRSVQDVTGLDKSAIERLLLLSDFSVTLDGVFNDGTNASHDVFKTVASADVTRTVTLVISGQTLTNECLLTDYSLTRASTGEFTYSVPGVLQSGTDPTWA
jgi:hypothetical protein